MPEAVLLWQQHRLLFFLGAEDDSFVALVSVRCVRGLADEAFMSKAVLFVREHNFSFPLPPFLSLAAFLTIFSLGISFQL